VIEVKAIITATAFVFKQMHGIPWRPDKSTQCTH
jgi:hypothetical protein